MQLLADAMVQADRDELLRWWIEVNEFDDINIAALGAHTAVDYRSFRCIALLRSMGVAFDDAKDRRGIVRH